MRVVFLAVPLMFAIGARADEPMRCGSSYISSANSVEELLAKCGEPDSREVRTEDVRTAGYNGAARKIGTTTIETWVYQRSSQAAPRVVTIVDGKIKRIETKT